MHMRPIVFRKSLLDEIFADGKFTDRRIEEAAVVVMYLAQHNKAEANKAKRMLGEMLLIAIADRRCSDPQRCAACYCEAMRAAFGEPTCLSFTG